MGTRVPLRKHSPASYQIILLRARKRHDHKIPQDRQVWLFHPHFSKSSMKLKYSNSIKCTAVICQKPKRGSLLLDVKTDEAGREDSELVHQKWHCKYLTPFSETATDQSQKLCTPVTANTHPRRWKDGPCLIKIQTGEHVTMEVLHWINLDEAKARILSMQKCW